MEAFLELVADGRVTPLKLVTHRFPIDAGRSRLQADGRRRAVSRDPADLSRRRPTADRTVDPRREHEARRGGARGTGFIGFGNYAKAVLLPALKKAGNERLTTVVTSTGLSARTTPPSATASRTPRPIPQAVLGDAETDCVFIATRHDSHARLAVAALARPASMSSSRSRWR